MNQLRLHHLGLACHDVARTAAFYQFVFEAEPRPDSGLGHRLLGLGDVQLALVPRRPDDPPRPAYGHHLAFHLDGDRQATVRRRLEEVGAPIEVVRGRLYTQDPDGFTLELSELEAGP